MFDAKAVLMDAFVERLQDAYRIMYGDLKPEYVSMITRAGRMALDCIADSDAPYHDIEHTMMVTLVGQDILIGKHLRHGGVGPRDWLHFVVSLLCHDIGYVRGICEGDSPGLYVTGVGNEKIRLSRGATDASLAPYHVNRGKLFVRERFRDQGAIDVDILASNIERTRFPVPGDDDHRGTRDYPGLARAADLIGQLSDPRHGRKCTALFRELVEAGTAEELGFETVSDLRDSYPAFYWNVVMPHVRDGLGYLSLTQEGREWIAHLYSNVFSVEHQDQLGKPWSSQPVERSTATVALVP